MAMSLKRRPMRKLSRFQEGGVVPVDTSMPSIMPADQPQIYQPSTSNEGNMISSGIASGLKIASAFAGSSKKRGGKVTKVVKPKTKGKRR